MSENKNLNHSILEIEQGGTTQFTKLLKICENFFGEYRINSSHYIFKTPWQGDPRINLQKGK
ncbi:MAG TPA: hypothetical protein VGB68_15615, partial [Pyrinomonadaceae bacterium]